MPRKGDKRTRKFFAIFPFDFDHVVYWWECVTVAEVYQGPSPYDEGYWKIVNVVDKEVSNENKTVS